MSLETRSYAKDYEPLFQLLGTLPERFEFLNRVYIFGRGKTIQQPKRDAIPNHRLDQLSRFRFVESDLHSSNILHQLSNSFMV